jgi:hypothetical protein
LPDVPRLCLLLLRAGGYWRSCDRGIDFFQRDLPEPIARVIGDGFLFFAASRRLCRVEKERQIVELQEKVPG